MTAHPKIVAVDVRGNETLGEAGCAALITVLKTKPSDRGAAATHQPRSICGVTASNSRVDVPRTMPPCDLALLAAELECSNFAEGVGSSMGGKPTGGKEALQLNRRSNQGSDWIPLIWAAKHNHVAIVTQLLETGTKVDLQEPENQAHNKYTGLHWAAQKGHVEMTALLIEKGAKLDTRDKHSNTPKMLAEKKLAAERSGAAHLKQVVDLLEAAEQKDKGKKR